VRNIGSKWRNLADGLLRIGALETQFRAQWGQRLEKAQRKRNEAERQQARRRGQALLISALLVMLLMFTLSIILLRLASPEASAAVLLAFWIPIALAIYGVIVLLDSPTSIPVPMDLSGLWWHTVSRRESSVRRSGPAFAARHYGDQGEEAFISYLSRTLSKEYVAIRGPLVTWNLDADVIVAGPTGVWVYEVKNWSGEITCEHGQWQRVKTYRERGGRLVREHEFLRPFDSQWAKEAGAVQGTLRRLPDSLDLPGAVGGGLVFTHAKVSVHVDGSCAAWVGRPSSCVETLWSSPEIPTFTMEKRLRVLDALLEWSDGLHEHKGEVPWETASSVELAERLYNEAVYHAVSYCSQIGELGDVTISEEVKEARKRAFWHPHPDDPPNH
jgi:hypothetical protein